MENLFLGISKYLFIIVLAFFDLFSFVVLADTNKKVIKNGRVVKRKQHKAALFIQSSMIYVFHLLAYINIYLNTKDATVIIFYGAQVILFVVLKGLHGVFYENDYNKGLLNNVCMFLSISFVMLTRLDYSKAIKQFAIVCIASVLALIIPVIIRKYKNMVNLTYIYCFAGLAFLAVVLIMGQISGGAKLSITLLGFSFQPSEFVKILYVLFIAALLNKSTKFSHIIISAIFAGAHVLILVLSTDLGSALIFFVVYVMMIYVATGKVKYLIAGTLGGVFAAVMGYNLFYHIRVRVAAYLDPWAFIETGGYQVAQSLFAIGTGGFLGLGLYKGLPKSIPLVEQDFMFAAISEELGGFFAICLIVLFMSCFICIINIAMNQEVLFFKLTGLGLAITYVVQTILTIGGAIKFIPSTGVTLPLISYGGSSVLCTMIMFAIFQGLSLRIKDEAIENDLRELRMEAENEKRSNGKRNIEKAGIEKAGIEKTGIEKRNGEKRNNGKVKKQKRD